MMPITSGSVIRSRLAVDHDDLEHTPFQHESHFLFTLTKKKDRRICCWYLRRDPTYFKELSAKINKSLFSYFCANACAYSLALDY